jgi:hypothetical protein
VKIKFGDFSFMDEKENLQMWMDRYNNGACTLNEYRTAVGMKKYNGEEGDKLKPKSSPFTPPPEEE